MTTHDYSYLGVGNSPLIPQHLPGRMHLVRAMAYSSPSDRGVIMQICVSDYLIEDTPAIRAYVLGVLRRSVEREGETLQEDTLRASRWNGVDTVERLELSERRLP